MFRVCNVQLFVAEIIISGTHRAIPHASSPTHSKRTVPVASLGPQRGSLSKVGHVAVVPSQNEEPRNNPYFPSLRQAEHVQRTS
jgi:hypothetical protein